MATKTKKVAAKQPVDELTGTLRGESFTVVLDDISIGDKWSAVVLPKLQKDGLGRVELHEGVTSFEFKDERRSTVYFKASGGNLEVDRFEAFVEDREASTSDSDEEEHE